MPSIYDVLIENLEGFTQYCLSA